MDIAKLRALREVMQLVELPPIRPEITKEICIAELQRVAKQLGHTPTQREFNEHGSMCVWTVEQLFGTWNKALSAAGLKINENKTAITKIQALTELKCVAKHLGHTPTGKEFNEHGSMHRATVEKLFGTWNKALDAASLKRTKSHGHTKTQALAELKRVAKQLRHAPSVSEFNGHGSIGTTTIRKLFGTWNKSLKAAGLNLNHDTTPLTKTQALAELKRVTKQLGSTPTRYAFSKHGTISTTTVEKLFGTWNKALKAAGLKLNINR